MCMCGGVFVLFVLSSSFVAVFVFLVFIPQTSVVFSLDFVVFASPGESSAVIH